MKWHKIGGTGLRHLSMGMSHDFELAIAEGATMVRIGTRAVWGDGRGCGGIGDVVTRYVLRVASWQAD